MSLAHEISRADQQALQTVEKGLRGYGVDENHPIALRQDL